VQENAKVVSVQPLSAPNVASERNQDLRGVLPKLSNVPNISFPSPEKSNFSWEDSYFEEIKEFNLKRLKSKALHGDDFEVRHWSGFGIILPRGFVLIRTSGEWSAVSLNWEFSENRQGKRDIKPINKKLDAPKSGWDAAWQKLADAGILILPDAEKINCISGVTDGMSYIVEYKLKNTYRTYMYDNPEHAECEEAKRMLKINKIIGEEFYKSEVKVDNGN
jgi:hypothetical protein